MSEPICSFILNNSSYALQPPMSPVFLISKKDQRQPVRNENKMRGVWQESQHGFYTVAAGKRMRTQVGKCCKIRVKGLGQNYNRALDTGKLN